MGLVRFTYTTIIHESMDDVWTFFSTASNLQRLTSFPKVTILSNPETKAGNEIVMKLSFVGATLNWVSSIEKVEQPFLFVDRGVKLPFPFKEWRHEHHFMSHGDETIMTDSIVCRASVPNFLVKLILLNMFKSREKKLTLFFAQPDQ
ncbi:hypothetical protein GN156_08360 [bacterium LRH843]|nr:hypothetical protein [bacterium LRH843]